MNRSAQFPFIEGDASAGEFSRMPLVPVELATNRVTVTALGLLDTGATVNVLPYELGVRLGFDWQHQTTRLQLGGNLANAEARAVAVHATIATFEPVLLAFAWTLDEMAPLLLGQINFFQEFDVCFYRSRNMFAITPIPRPQG